MRVKSLWGEEAEQQQEYILAVAELAAKRTMQGIARKGQEEEDWRKKRKNIAEKAGAAKIHKDIVGQGEADPSYEEGRWGGKVT